MRYDKAHPSCLSARRMRFYRYKWITYEKTFTLCNYCHFGVDSLC